ncbi:MAG: branched-chain amino acid ABC transporter permease [Candidatus Bathyarchaeia archaeon]
MIDQLIILGLTTGLSYALITMGFSFIFGVSKILNLAHTAFSMMGAYLLYTFFRIWNFGILLSVFFSLVLATLLCLFPYLLCLKNKIRENILSQLILTIGVAMFVQGVIHFIYGTFSLGMPSFIPGFIEILGVRILNQHLIIIVSAIILYSILAIFLKKTKLGIAVRATAQDAEVAALCGMNIKKIYFVSGAIGIFLAVFAGVFSAPLQSLTPWMWAPALPIVMAAAVLGGLGSIKGSILASLIFGFVFTGVSLVYPELGHLKEAIAFVAVVLIFLIRPGGLFGVQIHER